jgi:phage tail sheath protein FI
MPVQPTFPGVYVQEVPSGVRTITGVSTSVAAFVGMVNRGSLDRPARILSFADYERKFGNDTAVGEMTDQVRQFFLNGGQQAYIVRIANGAAAARVTLTNETATQVLTLIAKDAGTIGDAIRVEIDYDTSSPESTFNLRAFRLVSDGQGGVTEDEQESFLDLTMNPASSRYAVNVISQQSALLNAELPSGFDPSDPTAIFEGYAVAGLISSNFETATTDAINATGGGNGQFRISVDGNPFVDVVVQSAHIAGNLPGGLQSRINTALLSLGATVTVTTPTGPTAGDNYLLIRSNAEGGSVRLRSAAANDISAALLLGLDRGGLEVDGFAAARPAPTGFVFRLGELNSGQPGWLGFLSALAGQDPASITSYELRDAVGTHAFSTLNLGAAGTTLSNDGSSNSLANVQDALDLMVTTINEDAGLDDDFNWTADRHGFRLVLTPDFGDSNTLAISFTSSDGAGGGYNIGAHGFAHASNVAQYSLNASAAGSYQTGAGGDDGDAPTADAYNAAYVIIDREVDLFNLLILPRATGQDDDAMAELYGPASVFCQQSRAFLIVDPRHDWITADDVDGEIADVRIGLATDHAAIYWPRLTVSVNGSARYIDPSGSVAGLMARIDSSRGVWKAPAGTEATIRGVRGVEHAISDGENGLINPQAVNALRVFPAGVVSWGARTMVGFNNSGNDDYKYVPIRRLALFMEESLYRGLQFAVFEPNDEPLWAQIRLAAGAFMNNLFRQGAFQGQKSSDAYFVKVDSETTTQNDINLGIVNVVIGFAPLKPAEFVIITLQQRAGQVNV